MIDTAAMQTALLESTKKRIRISPRHSLWASQLAHPCLRYLEYGLTRWQDQMQVTPELQAIFDEGREQEELVVKKLKDSGFEIRQNQRPLFEKVQVNGKPMAYGISGRLDFEMMHPTGTNGEWYPVEVKSMAPFIWESINTVADMLKHKRHYIRMYPAQLMLYLYLGNKERGLMVLKNKVNGQFKFITVDLDWALAEGLLKTAEAVNEAVELITIAPEEAEKLLTERIPFDERICGECAFRHICLPDEDFGKGGIIVDEVMESTLERWAQLRAAAKEFEQLEEVIKEDFKKKPVGKYLVGTVADVTVRTIPTTKYELPEEVKKTYAQPSSYVRVDIKLLPVKP